jgi:hypothetical protein
MRVLQQERISFAAAQGSIADLAKNYDSKIMPIIGVDFTSDITWNGVGKPSFDEFLKLKDIIRKTHEQGKKVRVYNCPDEENVWDVLLSSGVDLINCSDPILFNKFLSERKH